MQATGPLSAEEVAALLATPAGQAALLCSHECPLRYSWLLHLASECTHWRCPGGGRVACVAQGRAPPEGWAPTEAQRELSALLVESRPVPRNGEGDEGRG